MSFSSRDSWDGPEHRTSRYNPDAVSFEPIDPGSLDVDFTYEIFIRELQQDAPGKLERHTSIGLGGDPPPPPIPERKENGHQTYPQPFSYNSSQIDDIWVEYGDELDYRYHDRERTERRRVCAIYFICVAIALPMMIGLISFSKQLTGSNKPNNITSSRLSPYPRVSLDDLKKSCAASSLETSEGSKTCNTLCSGASCCYFPPSHAHSCQESHEQLCEDILRHCVTVFNPRSWAPDLLHPVTPPLNIAEACTSILPDRTHMQELSSLSQSYVMEKFSECEELCSPASCCTSPHASSNCFSTHADICLKYAPYCGVSEIQRTDPEVINEVCGDKMQYKECFAACSSVACCFPTKFGDGTQESICAGGRYNCDGYQACETLPDFQFFDVEGAMSGGLANDDMGVLIKEACKEEEISASERQYNACYDLCHKKECCYQHNKECPTEKESYCDGYHPCDILNTVQTTSNISTPLTSENIVATLNAKCSSENLSTADGFHECSNLCLDRRCCFDQGPMSCIDSNKDWCKEFDLCHNLEKASLLQNRVGNKPPKDDNISVPPGDKPSKDDNISVPPGDEPPKDGNISVPPYDKSPRDDNISVPPGDKPSIDDNISVPPDDKPSMDDNMPTLPGDRPQKNDHISVPPVGGKPSNDDNTTLSTIDNFDDDIIDLVNMWCSMDKLSVEHDTCNDLCSQRECCWEEYGCYDQKKKWCEEFAVCENLLIV